MSRPLATEKDFVDGAAGPIEVLIDQPEQAHGLALVCHPHPLFGGTNTNKVAHTLARTLRELGQVAIRPNFRGVGGSAGEHDNGNGETEDMLAVIRWAQSRWNLDTLVLAGFSFGGYVQLRVATALSAAGKPPRQLILVGTATGDAAGSGREYHTPVVPDKLPVMLIHGEQDDIVPLGNVLDWARPQELPVCVIPGADHFFHGKLHLIRELVLRHMEQPGNF